MLRRVAATKANASNALFLITWFMGSINIEHIHPLEGGFLRLKFRRDRRPGFALEPVWSFYPKYFAGLASKLVRWTALYVKLRRIYLRIKHDPQRYAYTDIAMTPVAADEAATHELFNTGAAQAYIAQAKRVKQAQEGHAQPDSVGRARPKPVGSGRVAILPPVLAPAAAARAPDAGDRTSCRRCRPRRRRAARQTPPPPPWPSRSARRWA